MRFTTAAILAAVFLSAGCRPKTVPAPKSRVGAGGPARVEGADVVNAQGEILVKGLWGRTISPGGKWLIGAEYDPATDAKRVALVQMKEGRLEATLPLPADAAFAGARWSSREDRVLVAHAAPDGAWTVWLVDVEAPKASFQIEQGATAEIFHEKHARVELPERAWSPNGRVAAFVVRRGEAEASLVRVEPGRPPTLSVVQTRTAAPGAAIGWTESVPRFAD